MNRFLSGLVTLCLILVPFSAFAATPGPPQALCFINTAVQYADGKPGPYSIATETFENPLWIGGQLVTVLFPRERTDSAPVIFFSHGLTGTSWTQYRTLISHVVSRGYIVVYSPYPSSSSALSGALDIMWNGFQLAAERYASRMNLQQVGFIGHSYGGGAVPAMAWNGLVDKGWGKEGAFLFILSPAPAMQITDSQLASFPKHSMMIVQSYDEDTIVSPSWAINIYTKIGIPAAQKAYYNLVKGTYAADHFVPTDMAINDLDAYAVRTPLDALIEYTFRMAKACDAKSYGLLGYGDHFQHTVTKTPALP